MYIWRVNRVVTSIILLSAISLSGCVTTMLNDKSKEKDKEVVVHLSDQITHIGKPAQSINGYEHALVLVGKNNGYLLTSKHKKKPQLLEDIFTKIDTQYLYLDPHDLGGGYMKQQSTTTLNIDINNDCYKDNKLCSTTKINFYKPYNLMQTGEFENMESLGFNCFKPKNSKQGVVSCSQTVSFEIHLVENIKNKNSLKYAFKQPVNLKVTEIIEKENQRKKSLKLLTPVAIGIDVITLPLQFLFFIGGMGKYGV